MNIVRNRRLSGFGQFDPSSDPLLMDVMYPSSQDTTTTADEFPMYNDPGLITAENVSAAQASQAAAAAATVPKPGITVNLPSISSQPVFSSPAPRVNIPTSPGLFSGLSSSTLLGIPTIGWLGLGLVLALSVGGGRRRR